MVSQNETLINGLYARIDWLEFTITEFDSDLSKRDNVSMYIRALGLHEDLFDEQGKGGFGYKSSVRHISENIFVYYDGSENMGIHFRISGYAVTYLLKRYLEKMAVSTPFGKGYELVERGERREFQNAIRKKLMFPLLSLPILILIEPFVFS